MKKYKMLIFFVIGIGLIISGLILGGSKQINDMIPKNIINKLNIKVIDIKHLNSEYHDCNYDFQDEIDTLEISLKNAVINIERKHIDNIKVNIKDARNDLSVIDGDKLIIKDNEFITVNNKVTYIDLVLPHDYKFKDANIEVGAGRLEINDLCTDVLNVDVGAGEAIVNGIVYDEINVNCGIGNVVIESKTPLSSFSHKVDCAIGNVIIGDEKYSGIVDIERVQGDKIINVDCGIGNVEIKED